MKTEVKKFTEECEKIKKKFIGKTSTSNSDSVLGLLKDMKSNTELSKSFMNNEAKTLIKLSEQIVSEYNGDKAELKEELDTLFEKYFNDIVTDLMNMN